MKRFLIWLNNASGQALPLTLVALALGTLLVSPFLVDASVNVLASRRVDSSIRNYYSADAGVEWALWHIKNNPSLTSSASYTAAPLQPTPAAVNGSTFPVTEVRYVANAGASETITPAWQAGSGPKCYAFTTTELGSVFGVVSTTATSVWIALLPGGAPCTRPVGLNPMTGASPYSVQFQNQAAGAYELLVETNPAGTGTITINYPVVSYDIRSAVNGRTIIVRATANVNAVRIISWQMN